MTQLVCPLCKKFNSYDNFSVAEEADIIAVEVRGLGRGKGVQVINRYSILAPNDPVVLQIKDRILLLVKVLADNGCLDVDEVLSTLNIQDDPEEIHKLENEVEALEAEQKENMEVLSGMVESIEETVNTESYKWTWDTAVEDDPMEALNERLNTLINEYESIVNSEEISEIITNIEEALVDEYEWDFSVDDEPGEALKERANVLIEEYESMVAEEEEEDE